MVTFLSSSTVNVENIEVAVVLVLERAETFEDLDSSEVLWCRRVGTRGDRRGGSSGLVRRGVRRGDLV